MKQPKAKATLKRRRALAHEQQPLGRVKKPPKSIIDSGLEAFEGEGVRLQEIPVEALGLGPRQRRSLYAAGIRNIHQLSNCSESDLLCLPRFGVFTVQRIKVQLRSYLSGLEQNHTL